MSFLTAGEAYKIAHAKNQGKSRKKLAKRIDEYLSMGTYFMNYNYGDELEKDDVVFLRELGYRKWVNFHFQKNMHSIRRSFGQFHGTQMKSGQLSLMTLLTFRRISHSVSYGKF